jgi:hypothetical protein
MPYFVFEIVRPSRLTRLETTDRYQEARALVRRLRQEPVSGEQCEYRMVFAGSEAEAHKLLSRPRDERVIGED